MDIHEYISSGVLELFVAGALSDDEAREVQLLAARHPEIRAEVDAIQEAFEALATAQGVNPPPYLRALILEKVAFEKSSPLPPSRANETSTGTVIRLPRRTRYLLAASITIAVLSSSAAGYMGYRWNQAQNELADAHIELEQIARRENTLKARYENLADAYGVVRERRMVMLKGLAIAPNAMARVYWDSATHRVALDPTKLPPAPSGKQYQLWAIAGGKPVDAGVIAAPAVTDAGVLVPMKDVAQAEAFAITLEPTGGSAAPTLSAMYVMGSV